MSALRQETCVPETRQLRRDWGFLLAHIIWPMRGHSPVSPPFVGDPAGLPGPSRGVLTLAGVCKDYIWSISGRGFRGPF